MGFGEVRPSESIATSLPDDLVIDVEFMEKRIKAGAKAWPRVYVINTFNGFERNRSVKSSALIAFA